MWRLNCSWAIDSWHLGHFFLRLPFSTRALTTVDPKKKTTKKKDINLNDTNSSYANKEQIRKILKPQRFNSYYSHLNQAWFSLRCYFVLVVVKLVWLQFDLQHGVKRDISQCRMRLVTNGIIMDHTFWIAVVQCRHRNGLKWLRVGTVGLRQVRMCGEHNRRLDVWQRHNVFGDLLHLWPVNNTGYDWIHCRWSNLLKKLLLTGWKTKHREHQIEHKTGIPKSSGDFLCHTEIYLEQLQIWSQGGTEIQGGQSTQWYLTVVEKQQ